MGLLSLKETGKTGADTEDSTVSRKHSSTKTVHGNGGHLQKTQEWRHQAFGSPWENVQVKVSSGGMFLKHVKGGLGLDSGDGVLVAVFEKRT